MQETKPQPPPVKPRKTARRGYGEGSIFQRADGRWVATVTIGHSGEGKRIRKTVYGDTKKEAQDELTKLQGRKLDGMLAAPGRQTVAAYLDHWLENTARTTIRKSTYTSYESVIRLHVSPRIGGLQFAKLSPSHVQGLYGEMERGGASPRLRQLTHAVLHRAFKMAVKRGIVPRNVCDAVDPPRVPKSSIKPLSQEQAAKLLETAKDDRLEALYVLALTTGLREGELFGLQWCDVDLEAGTVAVRHTLQEVKGSHELTEPKTAKSRRRVDLPQMAVKALWRHKAQLLAEGQAANPRVFCDTRGGWLRRSHFHAQWYKPLLKRAELPPIRFHDLRHTSATLLLSAGVHPKVVQERLGHSNISMTMDTYSHVLPSMQLEAAGKIDGLFAEKPAAAQATPKTAAG